MLRVIVGSPCPSLITAVAGLQSVILTPVGITSSICSEFINEKPHDQVRLLAHSYVNNALNYIRSKHGTLLDVDSSGKVIILAMADVMLHKDPDNSRKGTVALCCLVIMDAINCFTTECTNSAPATPIGISSTCNNMVSCLLPKILGSDLGTYVVGRSIPSTPTSPGYIGKEGIKKIKKKKKALPNLNSIAQSLFQPIGVDCHLTKCQKCHRNFDSTCRRIWCRICYSTICQFCCTSPALLSPNSRPIGSCTKCSVKYDSVIRMPSCIFSLMEGSEWMITDENLNEESDRRQCTGCGCKYGLRRRRTQCKKCERFMCSKCIVSTDKTKQCVGCSYGELYLYGKRGVDKQVASCLLCGTSFSLTIRRHWCRRCGRTICKSCSASHLSISSRRHPNCICRRCYVPYIFRLGYNLAHYILEFADQDTVTNWMQVCRRFQKVMPLPFPTIGHISEYYSFDEETDLLGQGALGRVFRCKCRRTKHIYAIKMIEKCQLITPNNKKYLLRECEIHQQLDHPNTTKVIEVLQTCGEVYVIMEFGGECDLVDYLIGMQTLPEAQVALVTVQILNFLDYLHAEKRVVHRDLKLDNIVISIDGGKVKVKVIDFGLAKFIPDDTVMRLSERGNSKETRKSIWTTSSSNLNKTSSNMELQGNACTPCGTLRFCAPEVLNSDGSRRPIPSQTIFKRDIFSVGVIVYTLLYGRLPFQTTTVRSLRREMLCPPPYTVPGVEVSEEAQFFVKALLNTDPTERPSASEALKCPWLYQGLDDELPPISRLGSVSIQLRNEKVLARDLGHGQPVYVDSSKAFILVEQCIEPRRRANSYGRSQIQSSPLTIRRRCSSVPNTSSCYTSERTPCSASKIDSPSFPIADNSFTNDFCSSE